MAVPTLTHPRSGQRRSLHLGQLLTNIAVYLFWASWHSPV
jgi:hypothetical protein